eukprot:COSAG02_NODE_6285_length_3675_cov_41.201113_2_plen_47_part_00
MNQPLARKHVLAIMIEVCNAFDGIPQCNYVYMESRIAPSLHIACRG